MANPSFIELLQGRWKAGHMLCVGLDIVPEMVPPSYLPDGSPWHRVVGFACAIVDATHELVCAFKLNRAFYESHGAEGINALEDIIYHIRWMTHHTVPIIDDAKRADIGNSSEQYAKGSFDHFGADAITVNPYLGGEALEPFLRRTDKGVIVLCKTSNPGGGEFQDLHTLVHDPGNKPTSMSAEDWLEILCSESMTLYERVAFNFATKWNQHGNCCLVVGATYPVAAKAVRGKAANVPFLIPGIGVQGGDLEATILASHDGRGLGMVINAGGSIVGASRGPDFAEAAGAVAVRLDREINLLQKEIA